MVLTARLAAVEVSAPPPLDLCVCWWPPVRAAVVPAMVGGAYAISALFGDRAALLLWSLLALVAVVLAAVGERWHSRTGSVLASMGSSFCTFHLSRSSSVGIKTINGPGAWSM